MFLQMIHKMSIFTKIFLNAIPLYKLQLSLNSAWAYTNIYFLIVI